MLVDLYTVVVVRVVDSFKGRLISFYGVVLLDIFRVLPSEACFNERNVVARGRERSMHEEKYCMQWHTAHNGPGVITVFLLPTPTALRQAAAVKADW